MDLRRLPMNIGTQRAKNIFGVWNILLLCSFVFFILNGLFYVFYAGASFDEGNFLYKGFLYTSGLVKPYIPNATWTEYMPGGYILFGFSQLVFGKSFYAARFISFLFGFANFSLCYLLAKKMAGKTAAVLTLVFLVTNTKLIQSFSSVAVYSFSTFFLLLFFLTVISNLKIRLKTLLSLVFAFTAVFFRLSLLPNYFLLFSYIVFLNRKSLFSIIFSMVSFLLIPCLMIYPFLPGISHIFFQLPFIRTFVFKLGYPEIFFYSFTKINLINVTFALLEFIKFHQVWLTLIFAFLLIILFSENRKKLKTAVKRLLQAYDRCFIFLISFFIINLVVNFIGAYGHCPRCSIGYFYYYAFSGAIILGIMSSSLLLILKKRAIVEFVFIILLLYIFSEGLTTIYRITVVPFDETTLQKTERISLDIKNITKSSDKIFTITEPHYLYLAERVGFGPLINKDYGLRLSSDSKTLSEIGLWNVEMAEKWLDEANWALVDINNLNSLKIQGREDVYNRILSKINNKFILFKVYENSWPSDLSLYKKRSNLIFSDTN